MSRLAGCADWSACLPDTSLDYRDFLGFTHELTRDMQQVEEVFRRMVFNVAVCNSDDHAKNHAFCYRERVWTLSPAL